MIKKYIHNILISLDQLVNTLLGGDPDETISSRVGKNYDNSIIEKMINFLFSSRQKDHCSESIEWDEGNNKIIK